MKTIMQALIIYALKIQSLLALIPIYMDRYAEEGKNIENRNEIQ